MGVPNFLAYAQYRPVSPITAMLQGGLQTYGAIQQVHMNKLLAQQKQLQIQEEPAMAQLKQELAQAQVGAEQSIVPLRQAQREAALARAGTSGESTAIERERLREMQQLAPFQVKKMQQELQTGTASLGQLSGVAKNAASLDAYLKMHPANTPEGARALDAWNSQIDSQKAKTAYYGSNSWLKNMPTLQKAQFYNNLQQENAARTAKGLTPIDPRAYAQQKGLIPNEASIGATALDTHVKEIQGMQAAQGLPIQHPAQILSHVAQGHPSQAIATQQTGQPLMTVAQDPHLAAGAQPIAPEQAAQPPVSPQGAIQQGQQPQIPEQPQAQPEGLAQPITTPAGVQIQPQAQPLEIPAQAAQPQTQPAAQPQLLTQPDYGQEAAQSGLQILKETSDVQNRNKLLYGTQAERTISNMDADKKAMLYYTGPGGAAQLATDTAKAAAGTTTPRYAAYQRFVTNAGILGPQLLQYYGLGIQKDQREEVNQLTNPRNWHDNPKVTAQKWNAFVKTLNQEVGIRRKALRDPNLYYKGETEGKPQVRQYSDEQISDAARKYGLRTDQVKLLLRSKK